MSVPLTIRGTTYNYPVQGDINWGPVLTAWSTAVTNALAPLYSGSTLTITSQSANPATTGFLRLSNTDAIDWRNFANNGNLALAVNSSNQLTFNGTPIGASAALTNSHIFVGNVSNQPADVAMSGDTTITNTGLVTIANGAVTNAKIAAATGITLTKLAALTASRAVVSDASGFLVSATTTAAEIGFVNGVTSSIQTQLNTLTTNQGNYLPLAGGTMSGSINMGSNKIISLTSGTNTGEALAWGQSFTAGNITFSPTTLGLVGTTTNDNVSGGNVGEYVETYNVPANNFPASGAFGDGTSIVLTAGDWDLSAVISATLTVNTTEMQFGISTTSGNSGTGLQIGNNSLYVTVPTGTASGNTGGNLATYRRSLSGTTTLYLKVKATYTSTAPTYGCRLSARRVR